MEDASQEFQVFLSPSCDFYQQSNRGESSGQSKHRIVPVISNILSASSSSSSFTLNQRRSNVYKAVSGVFFQDTDVTSKITTKGKRPRDKRERRQSHATGVNNEIKREGIPGPVTRPRRSSSLTSVESVVSVSTDSSSKNLTEITRHFAPNILYDQNSGRKSRYSRVKERRRSSSQARNVTAIDLQKCNDVFTNSSHNNEHNYQPVRPRRTRSASRSCNRSTLSSDNNLDMLSSEDKLFYLPCQRQFTKKDNNLQEEQTNLLENGDSSTIEKYGTTNKSEAAASSGNIDFSVNDTDWRQYDVLVTQKLGTLLKKKEEPEGGYFSLEREEAEELEKCVDIGDHFQRDNCNESIYVAHFVKKDVKDLPQFDQYTMEEIYSEVPFTNKRQEVGFLDDEGLYEEIFFDKTEEQLHTTSKRKEMVETFPVKILVSPKQEVAQSSSPSSFVISDSSTIEKSSSISKVYIGDFSKEEKSSVIPSAEENQSIEKWVSCHNLLSSYDMLRKNKEKNMSIVDIINSSTPPNNKPRLGNLPWCGCYSRSNQAINHSSSCIQSRPGLLSTKCTLIRDIKEDNDLTNCKVLSTKEASNSHFSFTNICPVPLRISEEKTMDPASFTEIPEPDYELSDLDFDMFTPKTCMKNIRSIPETHLNRLFRPARNLEGMTVAPVGNSSLPEECIVSPQTFRGFLEDSLFNPPDTESLAGDLEGLEIRGDQVVTDLSSSSDESNGTIDDGSMTDDTSPWLEAQNEFEFVTFKENSTKISKFVKRRQPRKDVLIPSSFDNPVLPRADISLGDTGQFRGRKDETESPKRPTRRRKTTEINKVEEAI